MDGRLGLAAKRDREICITSTANLAQVARMVAQWFTHYATAAVIKPLTETKGFLWDNFWFSGEVRKSRL